MSGDDAHGVGGQGERADRDYLLGQGEVAAGVAAEAQLGRHHDLCWRWSWARG